MDRLDLEDLRGEYGPVTRSHGSMTASCKGDDSAVPNEISSSLPEIAENVIVNQKRIKIKIRQDHPGTTSSEVQKQNKNRYKGQ